MSFAIDNREFDVVELGGRFWPVQHDASMPEGFREVALCYPACSTREAAEETILASVGAGKPEWLVSSWRTRLQEGR